jgi:tripartite-type tricarboxylate transporter receptor subunit TctC
MKFGRLLYGIISITSCYKKKKKLQQPLKKGGTIMKRNVTMILAFSMCIFALSCVASTSSWSAEKYPTRSVEFVLGLAPGGAADITGRIMGKYFEKYLKVPFVIVNKPGPSQMMGASYVAISKPDGYTMGQLTNAIITAELTGQASGYKMDDLRPVCQFQVVNSVIAVRADAPWKIWKDFENYAKQHPGIKYGHQGVGSANHYHMETVNKYAKLGMIPVPFKGENEVLTMLLGKHIDVAPISAILARGQAAAGTIRILFAWDDPAPDGLDPSLPTLNSVYGNNAPDVGTITYIWVPKKTPDDIVQTLDQTFAKMMKDPEFLAECKKNDISLAYVSNTEVAKRISQKMQSWKEALAYLGLVK